MTSVTERLFALFAGLGRAHGLFTIHADQADGKRRGKARTVQEPLTWALWDKHLAGEQGIGVIPIRDDGTVRFAAIDVDEYDIDLNELEATLKRMKLPFVLCRTKSGGAHLYVFFCEDVPAGPVQAKLLEVVSVLGLKKETEIFPKQTELKTKKDTGNWINMPYFDAERTTRYCIHDGRALTVEEFVDLAEKSRVSEKTFAELKVGGDDSDLGGLPPCLRHFVKVGFPPGSMNNALFSMGVYARKRYGDDWQRHVWDYNQKYMGPGTPTEVQGIIKSLSKKDYAYKCNDVPLAGACSKKLCQAAQHGIDDGPTDPGFLIDHVTKILSDPPVYLVRLAGADGEIRMCADDLLSQTKFGKRVFEATNDPTDPIPPKKWRDMLRKVMANVIEEPAPRDASPDGHFWELVESFCTRRATARTRDEVLLGKVYTENGRMYFQSKALREDLIQNRFFDYKGPDVWEGLRRHALVEHDFWNIKGKGCNWWSLPAFGTQKEDFDVPLPNDEEEF